MGLGRRHVRTAGAAAIVILAVMVVLAPGGRAAPVNVARVTLQLDGPAAPGGTAHLSGSVSLSAAGAGVPLAPVMVVLDSSAGSASANATTDGAGHFAVDIPVPASATTAQATAYLLRGSAVEAASAPVTVLGPAPPPPPTTGSTVTEVPPTGSTTLPPHRRTTTTLVRSVLLSVRVDASTPKPFGQVERFQSEPAGIDCVRACIAVFPYGTNLTLVLSSPTAEEHWAGWAGACSNQPPVCHLHLTGDTEVSALIVAVSPTVITRPPVPPRPAINGCPAHQPCHMPTLGQLFTHLPSVGAIAGVLLLFVLLAFPAALFTATLEENYDTLKRRFISGSGTGATPAPRRAVIVLGGVAALSSVAWWIGRGERLGASLDLVSILAVALAFVAITAIAEVPEMLASRSYRHEFEGLLRALPGTALVALTAALVSTALHLEPGYVFGTVAGFAVIRGRRSDELGGKSAALGAASLFCVGMLAWVGWGSVQHYISHSPERAAGAQFTGHFTEYLIAGCIEAIAFAYIPLRFMDGARVRQWNGRIWLAIQTAALALAVLLIAGTGVDEYVGVGRGRGGRAIAIAAGFALFSVAFWGYFQLTEGARLVAAAAGRGEDAHHEDVDELGDEVAGVVSH